MNADPAVQLRLIDLQAQDLELDQLAHRRRTLPEVVDLEHFVAEHQRLRDLDVMLRTDVADLERQQGRAEAEVDQVRRRKERDRIRLDAGQVSSAKELESLQSEIASLERRQAVLEDAQLDVMERVEAAQKRAAQVSTDLAEVARRGEEVRQARDAVWAAIDAEVEAVSRRRATVAAEVPADLLALYERIRAERGGIGAVEIRERRCEGCRITIDPAEIAKIRALPADAIVRCDECRRIQVRTARSGL
ncbi:MAG: hypothetical protein ICV70_07870 [Jiangellaceae bacterium]|nr:hypothetical protein [Jiangellaceae bacterium]